MKDLFKLVKRDIFNRESYYIFFLTFLFYFILYIVFIANNITNQLDSLWVGKHYVALYNELECGRWLWIIIDFFEQGFKAEPIITTVSLIIFSISNVFLIETIGFKRKK